MQCIVFKRSNGGLNVESVKQKSHKGIAGKVTVIKPHMLLLLQWRPERCSLTCTVRSSTILPSSVSPISLAEKRTRPGPPDSF